MIKIPIRVLIVDDEEDFVQMLSLRLKETGEKVFCANSGKKCLEILKQKSNEIDVVLLDIKMPGMDGMEILSQIKKNYSLLEVIMLTGHGTTQTAVQGMKSGAFDYLLKPADFNELKIKLEQARKRKEEQEERIRKAEIKLMVRRSGDI